MSVADRVREARERIGLSARALDKKAEITAGHTTAIESGGRQRPAAETLRKIAGALGVTLDWLMADADETGPRAAVSDSEATSRAG